MAKLTENSVGFITQLFVPIYYFYFTKKMFASLAEIQMQDTSDAFQKHNKFQVQS